MLVFRQLLDATSSTYTYLLADSHSGEAVLIDPVFEQVRRDTALLRELGLCLVASLETHVHADHVTGAWLLKTSCGSRIVMSAAAAAAATGVDVQLHDGDSVAFGRRHLQARATPGHTDGCMSFVLDDHSMAFTGDSLLIRGCGRTDFQHGSALRLYRSVHEKIFTLPATCLLYPGHDYKGQTVTSVAEERRYNPRLGGDSNETDFAGYMDALGLPHPKLIAIAVPANLRCGRPEGDAASAAGDVRDPEWAPLTHTFGGLWEIEPAALQERLGSVQLIDVREPAEFTDALGHIDGAVLLPLADLGTRLGEIDAARPVVTVCRSGTRSAQAVVLLQRAGLKQIANLAGGMLRWRAEGLAVVGGND